MLVRCLYASRSKGPIRGATQDSILETARRKNPAHGITGILCVCHNGNIFIQVLEGGRDQVGDLLTSIMRDDRHEHIRILSYGEIGERKFYSWTMGQVDMAKINPGLLLKYHERAVLDPFSATGEATMALLDELVASGSILSR
ncbi:BLUF domain-containing protein [Aestuariivirga sp.]|uniref:BLUF domain-containing protein n=1 Tax=Aestuariivirga sp. TaxID=2650926 RepID=UPI0039E6498D